MTRGESAGGPDVAPARVNTTKASIVRVHDALLGGKDNFQVDRAVRDRLLAIDPRFGRASSDRRDFVLRVTRYLASEVGVHQFLDCGVTLPDAENIHEVAQRLNPESSVVYVSTDQTVLAHGRALLADNDRTHIVEADFRKPRQVLEHPTVTKHLDFDQPIAVFHVGTMHHVRPERDPAGIIAAMVDAVPAGSYLAFGHLLDPGPGHELTGHARELVQIYRDAGVPGWLRTREELTAMLSGLELLAPGLVPLADWWPDGPRSRPLGPTQRLAMGAVGRKSS